MKKHVFDNKKDAYLNDVCLACGATWTGGEERYLWSVTECPGERLKFTPTLERDIAERERALNESIAKGFLRRNHGEGYAQQCAIEALRAHLPRRKCGRVPPTLGYGPCTRAPHADGPCAHPLADEVKA